MQSLPKIGKELPKLPFDGFERVRDIEFYDGPLLTEFKDHAGKSYLASWLDADLTAHRWLVFETTRQTIYLYDKGKQDRIALVMFNEIPEDALPPEDLYFG